MIEGLKIYISDRKDVKYISSKIRDENNLRIIDYVKVNTWTSVKMQRSFNTVGSTFSLSFVMTDDLPQSIVNPTRNQLIKIEDDKGNRLFSGFILKYKKTHKDSKSVIDIAGYSIPAIIGSSHIPLSTYPRQYNQMSLRQITERLLKPFDILLKVDDSVSSIVDKKYDSVQSNVSETVATFLSSLCQQRDIVMTHTAGGKLLYTSIDTTQKEIGILSLNYPIDEASLEVDMEELSSEIVVLKEAPKKKNPSPDYVILKNPYSPEWTWKYSPVTIVMDSDDESGLKHAAVSEIRSMLLHAVTLNINLASWFINDIFVEPNKILIFSSEELGLFKKEKWFIQDVSYSADEKGFRCQVQLVRPECYTRGDIKNIFE